MHEEISTVVAQIISSDCDQAIGSVKILQVKTDRSDRVDRLNITRGFPPVQPGRRGMTDQVGHNRPGSD